MESQETAVPDQEVDKAIEAAARAYVDAINKVLGAEQRNQAAAEARMAV